MTQKDDANGRAEGPEAVFLAHLRKGRFMIQRNSKTGAHVFYPRALAPGDGDGELEWVEASGRATVHATTVARRRPEKGGDYNICLVTLEEGPRLMSRVIEIAPEEVTIGMPVTARIVELMGEPAVVFVPAGQEGAKS
ncbi:MAG: Zn-ribbon domain-containing OB-fold protein [Salinarimonas sp.]